MIGSLRSYNRRDGGGGWGSASAMGRMQQEFEAWRRSILCSSTWPDTDVWAPTFGPPCSPCAAYEGLTRSNELKEGCRSVL